MWSGKVSGYIKGSGWMRASLVPDLAFSFDSPGRKKVMPKYDSPRSYRQITVHLEINELVIPEIYLHHEYSLTNANILKEKQGWSM